LRARLGALGRAGSAWRDLRASMAAGGGIAPARAAPCSLLRRTGRRRRLAAARADVAALRAVAHRHGATVNDAILAAVAGALHRFLAARGESVETFNVTVPVAGRRSAEVSRLGNQVSPMLIAAPGTGEVPERLQRIAAAVRARKASATGPPPIAVLGTAFRAAAGLGAYRWFINHQRRMHTLVTHVRGPDRPVSFAGTAVTDIIPVAVAEAGNVTVSFVVLTYAGAAAITVVADPDRVPDLPLLTGFLRAELTRLAAQAHAAAS
jgi:hypothetical protein